MVEQKSSSDTDYKTIRSRLTRVVLVPSVVLLAMWAIFSSYLIYDGFYVRAVAVGVKDASIPAVQTFAAIQRERQVAMLNVSDPTPDNGALEAQRTQTDVAVMALRIKLDSLSSQAPPAVAEQVAKLTNLLDQLPQRRAQPGANAAARNESYMYYNNVLDAGAALFDTQARIVPDAAAGQAGLTATQIFRGADYMSRAASLGAGAISAGQFSTKDHLDFANLVGAYHSQLDQARPYAQPDARARYDKLAASDPVQRLTGYENELIEHGSGPRGPGRPAFTVTEHDWQTATQQTSTQLVDLAILQANQGADLGITNGNARFTEVSIGSILAFLGVLFGILLAVRNSRRLVDQALVTRLADLKTASLKLANELLPDIMGRLERGEHIDVAAEVPPLNYGNDEIGQVADAFNVAQYTAVSAAVKESQSREGINKVFLGIAHRNQVLVHRQLKVIDKMEREEDKPDRLETLFQLDHLATRARRNAENLIILAGEKPGRQWRKPVPLVDILRAAVAETEQYARIRVNPCPAIMVAGAAVSDTIHLLAELMDNATSFSSPRSQVEVHANGTPQGVLVEIEDRGLGMSPEDRDEANELLANPPNFDEVTLRGDPRLGLFVVGRLASRRHIDVQLRKAPDGGTVAVAVLPAEIIVTQAPAAEEHDPTDVTAGSKRRAGVMAAVPTGPVPTSSAPVEIASAPVDISSAIGNRRNSAGRTERSADGGRERANLGENNYGTQESFPVESDARPQLPRRRRQQNLAPQLRQAELTADVELNQEDDVPPSPDRMRGNVAAFQRGTREARRADELFEP